MNNDSNNICPEQHIENQNNSLEETKLSMAEETPQPASSESNTKDDASDNTNHKEDESVGKKSIEPEKEVPPEEKVIDQINDNNERMMVDEEENAPEEDENAAEEDENAAEEDENAAEEDDDDTSSNKSLRAVKLTRSVANKSMTPEIITDCNDAASKPTEFVILSTTSLDCGDPSARFAGNIRIKDELAEPIAAAYASNDDMLENDPMGLLELNDRSEVNSTRSNLEQDDVGGDDISSTCSSSVVTTSSTVNNLEWTKEYSWLLHEESDELYGYCLYCDVKLSVRTQKTAKQHEMSQYHQERCENYMAFRDEEEKNNLGTTVAEIKQEFGTDSYVAALKLKRKTQAEAFNNFNWRRWLEECHWLERDNSAGTIGNCKFCSVRLNVEFSYLRQRHQESSHHKDRAKQYEKKNKTKSDKDSEEEGGGEGDGNSTDDGKKDEPPAEVGAEEEKESSKSEETSLWFLQQVDHLYVRCTLCDTTLFKSSFRRHLGTHLHTTNAQNHVPTAKKNKPKEVAPSLPKDDDDETVSQKSSNNWKMYTKLHPWLKADPSDATFAYCSVCEKRILYGYSAAKRSLHENSCSHRANLKESKKKKGNDADNGEEPDANGEEESAVEGGDEDGDDEEEAEGDKTDDSEDEEMEKEESAVEQEDDEEEQEEEEQDEEEADEDEEGENDEQEEEEEEDDEEEEEEDEEEDDEEEEADDQETTASNKKKIHKKNVTRKNNEWYKQYAWCKKCKEDPNYCVCTYCKARIHKDSRGKHKQTKGHIAAEEKVLRRQKRKELKKIAKEKEYPFGWAVDIKGQPSLYYCKFCRVRISRRYSPKQHAVSKIHQINEKLYGNSKNSADPESENKALPAKQTAPKVAVKGPSFVTLIKQWQKRFTWLGYKRSELRTNYAFCKVCEQSLYVRTLKNVIKHQRSGKHLSTVNQLKRVQRSDQQEKETNELRQQQGEGKVTRRSASAAAVAAAADTSVQRESPDEPNAIAKESPKANSYKSTIESMKKRFSWIEKSSKAENVYCRYCNADVPLKVLFLRNHSNSPKHRKSVINVGIEKPKTEKLTRDESSTAVDNEEEEVEEEDVDDDVVMLEDNTEEIMISEQDDNWTVKSENMDEHEALDLLLQRSVRAAGQTGHNNANASRDDCKDNTPTDERPPKRVKRSHSFRRLNDSQSSSIMASILSTPLTLASCLGPLIQQQIQQQVTSSQQAVPVPPPAAPPPTQPVIESGNTYDLFFKSVSETMKNLPVDLAAEGKVKVMQIICDLEVKALKRQQPTLVVDREMEDSAINTIVNSTSVAISPNSSVIASSPATINLTTSPIMANGGYNATRNMTDNNVQDQCMTETVITPIYSNANASPPKRQQQQQPPQQQQQQQQQPQQQQHQLHQQQKPQQSHYQTQQLSQKHQLQASVSAAAANNSSCYSTGSNVAKDLPINPNQSPIIGVMDMNGLQTLQFKNAPIVKQIPKGTITATNGQSSGTTIRCIPFKNLTQSSGADVNAKITRIQVPMSATSTPTSVNSPNSGANVGNPSNKGLISLRGIHITKRANATTTQQQQGGTPVSVSLLNANSEKNTHTSYVPASTMQRWTAVSGSSVTTMASKKIPQSTTTTANYTMTTKQQQQQQHSASMNRHYK